MTDHSSVSVVAPLASAAKHSHEWVRDEQLHSLFHCAVASCDVHAVCPHCLGAAHLGTVYYAHAAGFVIYDCSGSHPYERRSRRRGTRSW